MITLDENFITDIIKYVGDLFSDFKLLIFLIIGIALALWIAEKIIYTLFSHREEREEK